jgi:hypothetical protein
MEAPKNRNELLIRLDDFIDRLTKQFEESRNTMNKALEGRNKIVEARNKLLAGASNREVIEAMSVIKF